MILNRRSGIISIYVTHPRLYKSLQVHEIAIARLVRCVLVRLSPNWPNTKETAVNGRNVATDAAIPIPQRMRAADEELTRPVLLGGRTVNRV